MMQIQINEYLEEEKVILWNNHGGRAGFSAISDKAHLYLITSEMSEKRDIVATMKTYLTSTFDIIDYGI